MMKKFMIIWIGELISTIGSGVTAFAFIFGSGKSIQKMEGNTDELDIS